jgi:hypothetical protein
MCMYVLPTKYKINGYKHGVWMKAYWQHSVGTDTVYVNVLCKYQSYNNIMCNSYVDIL